MFVKTTSELSLWIVIAKQGAFLKITLKIFAFVFYYGLVVFLHLFSFRFWNYSVKRCEVPLLEKYFDYDQVLNISTFRIKPDVKYTKQKIATVYCKYAERDYYKLLQKNKFNYTSIMENLQNLNEKVIERKCTHTKNKESVAYVSLSKFARFQNFNKKDECEDYIYYKSTKISLLFGIITAALTMCLIADRYGRKPILLLCSACLLLGNLTLLIPNYSTLIIANFVFGFGIYGCLLIYIILTETCDRKRRLVFGMCSFFCIPLSKILSAIIQISTDNWTIVLYIGLVLLLPLPWLIYRFIDEPPKYLMYSGRVEKCLKILEKNGFENVQALTIPDMPHINILLLIRRFLHQKLRSRHVYSFVFSFLLGITQIYENHDVLAGKFDPIVANLIIGSFETVHLSILTVVISRDVCGRKDQIFTLFTITAFVHLFAFVQYDHEEILMSIIFILVYSLNNTGLYFCLFYYMELYPTRFRVTCLSLSIMGICSGALTNFILLSLDEDPLLTSYFPQFVATTISWLLSCFACETVGTDIPDILKETP